MKGIILAAGAGSRLNGSGGNGPKCLVELGGIPLIERQLRLLRRCGIDDLVVVVGSQAERVRQACRFGVQFIENTRFAQTNSLYSLWLARPVLKEGFVVMNCDVLLHPQLLVDLLTARHDDALLIAYRDEAEPAFGDEEMKVRVRCGRVVEISKEMDPAEADGENLGVVKFGPSGARVLIELMDRLVAEGRLRDWAPRAFQEFARRRPLHVVGTRGLPWIEIDFPEDYRRAVEHVLPAIDARSAGDDGPLPGLEPVAVPGGAGRGGA
jgi:L-glutamine-phosphate cytidylyltransferase